MRFITTYSPQTSHKQKDALRRRVCERVLWGRGRRPVFGFWVTTPIRIFVRSRIPEETANAGAGAPAEAPTPDKKPHVAAHRLHVAPSQARSGKPGHPGEEGQHGRHVGQVAQEGNRRPPGQQKPPRSSAARFRVRTSARQEAKAGKGACGSVVYTTDPPRLRHTWDTPSVSVALPPLRCPSVRQRVASLFGWEFLGMGRSKFARPQAPAGGKARGVV